MPSAFHSVLTKAYELLAGHVGVFFTALTGSFFGAVSAYWTERAKEARKKRIEQHGAIVRSQMALISQLNTIGNIQKQHLNPFREDPNRAAKLITFQMSDTSLRVAYDTLAFLLMEKNTNLVLEVQAAEQSYLSAMEVLATRNEAQDILHKNSKIESFDQQTGACKIVVQDPRNIKMVVDFTNALYSATDMACERLTLQIQELEKAGKTLYPKKKFLKIIGEK